jgi:hypothetical protein
MRRNRLEMAKLQGAGGSACHIRVVLNADVSNFTGTGREYVDRVFVPGIPRAGDCAWRAS